MARFYSDVRDIMRRAIGRRNENDPDSNDITLNRYINDFLSLSMPNDTKLFENFGTLEFTIDENTDDGVYTFNDVGADHDFINISAEGFISITDQAPDSTSWNRLYIYQDPMVFFEHWGVNNEGVLIRGYPTEMLFYNNEMTFRTLPEQSYDVTIYGYKKLPDFTDEGDPALPFDYWLRYIAYGAALDYANDFRLDANARGSIQSEFNRQKNLMLTRTFNQKKLSRCQPNF